MSKDNYPSEGQLDGIQMGPSHGVSRFTLEGMVFGPAECTHEQVQMPEKI